MDQQIQISNSSSDSRIVAKKPYSTPQLHIYGDVVALTQNMACGGNDGPAGQVLS